jgi:ribosomal protein S27AE
MTHYNPRTGQYDRVPDCRECGDEMDPSVIAERYELWECGGCGELTSFERPEVES